MLVRWQRWLCGLWAGAVVTVGGLVAPTLFAVLDIHTAGTLAGRMFWVESRLSLGMAMLMFLLERGRLRRLGDVGAMRSATLLISLGALFLTVFGGFGLQPMIEAAKQGQATPLPFAALHGLAAGLYWVKAVLLLGLSWSLCRENVAAPAQA